MEETTALKTFVVERSSGTEVRVQAERGEQDAASTRVTFYIGDTPVASFINVSGWYVGQ